MSTTVRGTCHHDCPDSCGWVVTVEDGVAVRLRGDEAHPFSKGELCPKVNRYLDRVYSPDRILTPLRRVGAKGEGRFEPVSWDDALAEVASRIHAAIDRHGGEALLPYTSAGNQSLLALMFGDRLWHHLGATRTTGSLCGAVAAAGTVTTFGSGHALDPTELVHSRLIILWGTNTRLTNRHLWPFIEEARAQGAQVVVIDPLRTLTAQSADWFLQPLPGTDVAMMLAMMHVLVRDDLVDHDWVQRHTTGFDELAAHVADWTPERAAAICGIDAADIERLARLYGTIRPAAIRTLVGAEHHEHGAMFFRTLTCLPALVGAWRDRGGGYARSTSAWTNDAVDLAALTRPDLLAGRSTRSIPMPHLGRALTDPTLDPPIEVLFLVGVNAMVSVPGTEQLRAGLLRDDLFTVVHEQFLTDTARYADIVLPACTHIEAVDASTAWGHVHVGWNGKAIEPRGESVSNSEMYRRLACALGCTEPALFEDDLTVLRAALPGIDLAELERENVVRVAYPADGRPYPEGGFRTADGRFPFVTPALAAQGHPVLPTYTPAVESPDTEHPFALLTPKRHTRFLNSSYAHLPRHAEPEVGPAVELCAADAERLGLAEGDRARVRNHRATLELPVRITDAVRPGVVSVPWGWWSDRHPDGKVANSLTSDALTDWGHGVAFSDVAVAVEPADR